MQSSLFCFSNFINTGDVNFDVSMLKIYWGLQIPVVIVRTAT